MLDQDTAVALLTVADEAGATLALVGDRAQLPAVGRGGVFDIAAALTPRVFDLTSLHRFTDPDYAQLTLDLRTGRDPAALFDRLHALGLVVLHKDPETLRAAVAAERIDGAAITAATNDEARELNALIREDRVRTGLVDDARTLEGVDGLSIGRGDLIQTRRNDSQVGVANRQTWIVQQVGDDGSLWVRDATSDRKQQRTLRLPAEYVTEHAHLAYAATAYGVQGLTAPESHTILSDALSAAGVYVGLTRGREANRLHVAATDLGDAREQFAAALERDRADRGLTEATERARLAVAGIVADGPVAIVNTERARLRQGIEQAERQAARWTEAAARFDRQAAAHRTRAQAQQAEVEQAAQQVEATQALVVPPLIEQATSDASSILATWQRAAEARAVRSRTGVLRRRGADRVLAEAERQQREVERTVRQRWESVPRSPQAVPAWARRVAEQQAEADPRLAEARRAHAQARRKQAQLIDRQQAERTMLTAETFGTPYSTTSSRRRADDAARQAEALRHRLTSLEALPVTEAAAQIEARVEAERVATEALARRAARLHDFTRDPHRPSQQTPGIERDTPGL